MYTTNASETCSAMCIITSLDCRRLTISMLNRMAASTDCLDHRRNLFMRTHVEHAAEMIFTLHDVPGKLSQLCLAANGSRRAQP